MPNMSLFDKMMSKTRSKSSYEAVAKVTAALDKLTDSSPEKLQEEIAKTLSLIKIQIFGEGDLEPNRDAALLVSMECCKYDFPHLVAAKLALLDFESRKDAAQICGAIFRMDGGGQEVGPGVSYVLNHPDLLETLFQGYDHPAIALNCGSMLRDCVRSEALARLVLEGPLFELYFKKVEVTNFEVASDAFTTFKDLLTRHKGLVAMFLSQNYDEFFQSYTKLLQSENYVTRRQSLKLLGELLLDRTNTRIMVKYVRDPDNLKLMMILLKEEARSIQFEAFHVFKVFVANPNKSPEVIHILASNKERLLAYLGNFHTDKDDEQFKEEKAVIIKELSTLETPQEQGTYA